MISAARFVRALVFVVLGAMLLGTGCSDENEDSCANISCEAGVCVDGACANAELCEAGADCLLGFRCVDGNCYTEFTCDEAGMCERGICKSGACLNPDVCAENSDCLPAHACDSGVCVSDVCADVECERGVCDIQSAECVNEIVCTEATETTDCVEGFYCYGGTCTSGEDVCADITCDRGVCDAAGRECVSAEVCVSDLDCAENSFCNAENACQANVCDAQNIRCLRGECNAQTTVCENKEPCRSTNDCTDGFTCLGGTCVVQGEECGVEGCPGNQVCDVASSQSAVCAENPGGCGNALDCLAGRVCRSGRCTQPVACEDDAFEPNDAVATNFVTAATSHALDASLCSQDVDLYEFDTTTEPEFTGLLVVDLAYVQSDVGLGALRLELLDANGAVVATQEEATGVLRIEHAVTAVTRGVYTARVSDPATLGLSGIRYNLFIDLMEPNVAAACLNATELVPNVPVTNNSASGDSFEYGSTCTSADNPAGENIYFFDVTESSLVTLELDAAPNVDLSFAVRTRCESLLSEVVCVDPPGAADATLSRVFLPGRYSVIVQGVDVGGAYGLELSMSPTVCSQFDNSCVDADTSRFCKVDGTGFALETCLNGCDASLGSCARSVGDLCAEAIDASAGYSGTLDLGEFKNDYDPGFSGCVPGATGDLTAGPDVAFFVTLPDQHALEVDVDRNSDDAVIYLLSDCSNALTSCSEGVNAGATADERLVHLNESGADETFYVIVDSEVDSSYGDVTVDIVSSPIVCVPGSNTCVNDSLEICNLLGTVVTSSLCSAGCNAGLCNPVTNDDCAGALDITSTGSFVGRIEEYTRDYTPGFSGCTGRSANGPDATFLITPPAGLVVTVDLIPDFDGSLWVTSGVTCAANSCVAGSDSSGVGAESVQFVADGGSYTIIVDASSTTVTGQFQLQYSAQAPSCTPGVINGCNGGSLSYCGPLGLPSSYSCQGGACTGTTCDTPTGDVCIDALPLTTGTVTGTFTGTDSIDPGVGTAGACTFISGGSGLGPDTIYSIDLNAGEWLFASLDSNTSSTVMYLMQDCTGPDSCLAATPEDDISEIVYRADFAQRVYLVVDRTTSSSTTLTFDLTVDIRSPDCTQGSPAFCEVDGVTLKYCDFRGFLQDYTCDGTCSTNQCDTPAGDACIDPIIITDGVTVNGSIVTSTAANNFVEPAAPLDGLCAFDISYRAVGREDIYAIDVLPGSLIEATLNSTSTASYVYIMEDCEDTSTCKANNHRRGSGTVRHTSVNGGRYYVIVDVSSSFSTATYDLTVDLSPGLSCTPNAGECNLANQLEICDPTGLFVEKLIPCTNGCAHGRCLPDTGIDACATAPNIGNGVSIFASFADYVSDINLATSDCVGRTTPGPDVMYAVTLAPGEVLKAKVTSLGYEDPVLYVVSDCANPGLSCKVGQGPTIDDEAEILYVATVPETVYVVADSTSSSYDELFALSIEVVPQQCTAPNAFCAADNATLSYCNAYGLFENYRCDGTCTGVACDTPTGEICQDAITLSDGQSFSGSYSDFSADIDPGVGSCVLYTSNAQDGADAVFRVSLLAGELLNATLTTTTSTSGLYILSECGAPSENCLLAEVDSRSLRFVAPATSDYFLVVDSDSTSLTNDFTISVDITPGYLCTPGESTCISGVQNVCDVTGFAFNAVATCSNGCSNNEHCAGPTLANDTCADAMVISGSTRVIDRYDRFTNDYDPGSSSCAGGGTTGPDAAYRIDLAAGDVLQASVTPGNDFDDPAVYIVTDCALAASTCLGGDSANDSTATATYVATQAQSVFVIVDSSSSSDRDPFVVDFDIRPPECVPATTQCSGDVAMTCNALGFFEGTQCYFGCTAGACNPTPNDLCVGAIDVTAGGTFLAPISEYTAVYSSSAGSGTSCTGGGSSGREAVYKMDVNQGDFIELELTAGSDVVLWVSSSCAAPATVADNCIVGVDDPSPERLSFYAPATQTYFIYADLYSTGTTTGVLELDVSIQPAGTCTGAATCSDVNTVSYCDDGGTVLRTDTCAGGCLSGECGAPTGDWCGQVINATAGGSWTIDMDSMSNEFQTHTDACMGASAGNDAVFRVDLQPTDLLDVSVIAPNGENPKLALASDCSGINNDLDTTNCFATNDVSGATETLAYQAGAVAETVYVIVDAATTSTDDGSWDINIFAGQPFCMPGSVMCVDAADLGICNANGTGFVPYTCQGGCLNGVCGMPSGEVCPDAKPLLSGAMEPDDYTGTSDVNLGSGATGSCNFASAQPGTDHFYYVDLLAGETLTASFTTTSGLGVLYLTSDCSDGNACLSNTTVGGSGSTTYTATGPERIYVVMDRTTSGSTSSYNYTVSVSVQ